MGVPGAPSGERRGPGVSRDIRGSQRRRHGGTTIWFLLPSSRGVTVYRPAQRGRRASSAACT
eukprot:scaffold20568_cov67-Phaeocystis_antarctica.AAC.1